MAGNRKTLDLSSEQLDELNTSFGSIDGDGNGFISIDELQDALKMCGITLPQYKIRDLVKTYDTRISDGRIDIVEFKEMYAHLKKEHDFGRQFKQAVRPMEKVKNYVGTSGKSTSDTTHTAKESEVCAFAEWINRKFDEDNECAKYLPLNPDEDDLYTSMHDGILLCKMINQSVPDTIDERVINKTNLNVYRKHENITLALGSAQSIGCNIVNIGAEDIESGKPHLVLGLLWQIIRIGLLAEINLAAHPGLVLLLEEGETVADLRKLSPEDLLIRWVNYHLGNAGLNKKISNFGEDIKDSEAYTHLLRQIAPRDRGVGLSPLQEDVLETRAELMLQEAEKIDCRSFIGKKDVVNGNKKLNLAFVANLFNNYPALDKPFEIDEDIMEETREEKTYRNWMNSLGVDPRVNYLYSDLNDGLIIFQLYDIIKSGVVDWKKVIKKYNKMRVNFEKLENCNYAVELGRVIKFSLVGIGGQDIRDGNETLTLALVWQLMRAYTLAILSSLSKDEKTIADKEIISWAKTKLAEAGKKTTFDTFNDPRLADGRVIIDLVDALKPGVVKYDDVTEGSTPEDRLKNARYALSMAKRIGAKIYALPDDICELKNKMIMTIFACLMIRYMQREEPQ